MPILLILRVMMWAFASLCCLSAAFSVSKAADAMSGRFTPFGFLSLGILVAAIGYAATQLRRR